MADMADTAHMAGDSSRPAGEISSACNRFFATAELVSLFLHQADVLTVLKCQRVCQMWQDIINRSHLMPEQLFVKPLSTPADGEEGLEATLNTVMKQIFGPILEPVEKILLSEVQVAFKAARCSYSDLSSIPWARDGTSLSAPARRAFARKQASWRNMLVSQPPIQYLDWWHEWESSDRRTMEGRGDLPMRHGKTHQLYTGSPIRLGQLWDFLEGKLLRGCSIQVTFFPAGGSAQDDPSATEAERTWQSSEEAVKRGYSVDLPRIRVCSSQTWPGEGPGMFQSFNVSRGVWKIEEEVDTTQMPPHERRKYGVLDGDGVYWLMADCKRDAEASNERWSRSDAWEGLTLRNLGSSMSGGNSRRVERFRERAISRALEAQALTQASEG